MQARFYLPMYHRFGSPDPARDQHFEETQSWNIYSYCQNSPLLKTDPTGMVEEDSSFGMQVSQTMLGYLEGLACSLPIIGSRIDASLEQDVPEHQMIARDWIGKPVGTAAQIVGGAAGLKAGLTAVKALQVAKVVTSTGEVITVVSGGAQAAAGTAQALAGGALAASAMTGNRHGGGKNGQHTNQDAKDAAKEKYDAAKKKYEEAQRKPNKTKQDRIDADKAKREMEHLKRKADETGENHSRTPKGN